MAITVEEKTKIQLNGFRECPRYFLFRHNKNGITMKIKERKIIAGNNITGAERLKKPSAPVLHYGTYSLIRVSGYHFPQPG